MKIKLDENIPARLVPYLRSLGHDADSVRDEGLEGAQDPEVWRHVQSERRFFITQDLDFSDLRSFHPASHAGILLIRLASPTRGALVQRLKSLFSMHDMEKWQGCFVVATDRKIRIHRPDDLGDQFGRAGLPPRQAQ